MMKFKRHGGRFSVILVLAGMALAGAARAQDLSMTIDAARTSPPIHRYLYGQFTELLANMYEKGLWSEMLSDRKFYYPVNTNDTLFPVNRKRSFNRWRPVGPEEFVVMDQKAFVGPSAPMIKLAADTPRGITQAGFAVRKGRKYTGHIILAGDPGAKVSVSLAWGDGKDQQQTVALGSLSAEFVKYPLSFSAGGDSDNARFTVTGTGTGVFHIGVVSLMPADNVEGFRADMVALLKDLEPGIYRWPGGNFVSGYDWRDGIGDRDKRPPRYDYAWNTVEYNDVGTDEYLALCRLLGIDPYVCVNAGFGDAQSAAAWVEYVNGASDTPMGRLRAQNGHPEPYHVSWWGIGNEMYGEWQLGHMYIDHYVIKHTYFAQAMRAVDPNIKLIACGATPFETSTTARHHRKPLPAKLPYQYGSKEDWSFQMLQYAGSYMDFISEHAYPVNDGAFDIESQQFVQTSDPLVDRVRRTPDRIKCAAEAWAEYVKRLPQLKDGRIKMVMDEWASTDRGAFSATLCAAEGLNELFRHTDIFAMGGYTAFSSSLAFNGAESCYSATGLTFGLYRHHFGTIPVAVSGNAPQHPVKGTVGVDRPEVTSGSDTYPLDVVAALSTNRQFLTVAVVNPTGTVQKIKLNFDHVSLENRVKKWEIAVPDLATMNIPGQEPKVKVVETAFDAVPAELAPVPLSITLYEFTVK